MQNRRQFRQGMDPRANFPYDALGFGGSNTVSRQPDEQQFRLLRDALINGMEPFDCIIKLLQTKNSPPQVRQNQYNCELTAVSKPVLLIPTNTKRMGFVITNLSGSEIWFSYDYPASMQVAGAATLIGLPIPTGAYFLESNGLASINDIYVWTNDAEADFNIGVGGFEAVVTITPQNAIEGISPGTGG